ncbi:MAG: hypothetical protein VR78_08815 [Hoeflea sp. BRH_c9]|nr:MAG: hypothetical protein VR78_08815 [Hoeflea sp. BRH_c9]
MPKSKPKVFLDANIVISAGKPPGGPELARVVDLVEAGLVTIVTTDLTISEVVKKHTLNDYELIREIGQPHFRKVVETAIGVRLPEIRRAELKQKLSAKYEASIKAMFSGLRAKTLAIDSIKPSSILAAYAAGEGFFGGEGKKDQFPDAFAFECLKQEASEKEPVIIVSQDRDFIRPVESATHISLVASLADLFAALGLQIEAPEINDFLEEHKEELVEAVDRELANWGLQGDVEDSQIDETTVTEVDIEDVTAFRPMVKGDPILLVARLVAKANAYYTHPDWDNASYDSEDKVLIPRNEVSGETEVELQLDVSISILVDDDGEPAQIEELQFRNDDFIYVELHPYEDYK